MPLSYSEEFLSGKEAVLRLHNYAFTYSYCLVGWSIKAERLRLVCKHYRNKIRNYRKTTKEKQVEVNKQGRHLRRPNIKVAYSDYSYLVYVSYRPIVEGGGRKG